MKKKNRNWIGLLDVFIGGVVFISLLVIIIRYGISTAFFKFENYGVWENVINIGMFVVIGHFCIDLFFDGIDKIRGKSK